jgi:hypothetical protein
MRRLPLLGLLLLLALMALPAAAGAQGPDDRAVGVPLAVAKTPDTRPPGFKTTERQAIAVARAQPAVRREQAKHPDARLQALIYGGWRWEVDLMEGEQAWAVVDVGYDGRVLDTYTGVAANSYLARGHYNDSFDRPWVWLTFGVLFLLPFVDPRRLRRMLHLDLLVLSSFGISYALFESVRSNAAVLAVYPPLIYLLVRMLVVGLRPRRGAGRLVPVLPTAALAVGVIALFGARVALNVSTDRVMDIGYASVVGADRIAHKQELYVDNDTHGDTYGPINYIAYIPFELAFPWTGEGVKVPAAHAATLAFDLLTLVGLFLLGLRLRAGPEGRRLGLALAWAWAAFPFTLLGVMENTNDGLVAMLLVFSLLAFGRPLARGAMLGLAVAAKFSPGGLLLLFMRGRDGDGRRSALQTAAACLGVFAFAMLVYLPAGGLRELWACTMGYQLSRPPDWSLWTIYTNIGWTQTVLEALGVLLAVVVAVVPGRRTLAQTGALAAAVLIALQLPAGHWFYFYLMWCTPLIFVALFSAHREPPAVARAADEPADERAPALAVAS